MRDENGVIIGRKQVLDSMTLEMAKAKKPAGPTEVGQRRSSSQCLPQRQLGQ